MVKSIPVILEQDISGLYEIPISDSDAIPVILEQDISGLYEIPISDSDAIKDGEINCHRVIVADILADALGEDWRVEHV